jgi:hypothetical protein
MCDARLRRTLLLVQVLRIVTVSGDDGKGGFFPNAEQTVLCDSFWNCCCCCCCCCVQVLCIVTVAGEGSKGGFFPNATHNVVCVFL